VEQLEQRYEQMADVIGGGGWEYVRREIKGCAGQKI
jgi:hypothetical protein